MHLWRCLRHRAIKESTLELKQAFVTAWSAEVFFPRVLSLGLHACPVSHWIDLFTQMKSSISQKAGSAGCRKVCSSTVKTYQRQVGCSQKTSVSCLCAVSNEGVLCWAHLPSFGHTMNKERRSARPWRLKPIMMSYGACRWKLGCTWIYMKVRRCVCYSYSIYRLSRWQSFIIFCWIRCSRSVQSDSPWRWMKYT